MMHLVPGSDGQSNFWTFDCASAPGTPSTPAASATPARTVAARALLRFIIVSPFMWSGAPAPPPPTIDPSCCGLRPSPADKPAKNQDIRQTTLGVVRVPQS